MDQGPHWGNIRVILRPDNGKENGNYYLGVQGFRGLGTINTKL